MVNLGDGSLGYLSFGVVLSIYIIGGAWFQYNKGNAIDFQSALKEVVENFIELLKGLPSFGKEIIENLLDVVIEVNIVLYRQTHVLISILFI